MKRFSALMLLLMVLLCIATSAQAGNSVKGVKYRVNITMPAGHDHIYLYDQPSSSNGKNLGRINNGEYVTGISSVQRKGYTWIYCSYNGKKGYIRKNNLVEVSGGSSSGKSSSGSSGASSGSGNVTFSGNVNVRTGPGLDYGKLGTVNKGQTLTYAGDTRYDNRGVAWYSVYYNGKTGWVSSKYASVKGSSSGKSNSSTNSGNDKESSLRKRLSNNIGGKQILHFGYADYDGDGKFEAFAIVGNSDWYNDNTGELWFVSSNTIKVLERNKGYYPDESEITKLRSKKCYRLSEGYWGSGGYYRYWTVVNGSPYLYCEQEVWFSKGEITGETYYNLP